MAIERKDLTTGDYQGDGIVDELLRMVSSHLQKEYDANRLIGGDYTTAYIALVQAALQVGSQFLLNMDLTNANVALTEQKIVTEKAQVLDSVDDVAVEGVLGKQKALYAAQTLGFEKDAVQKLLQTHVDTWTIRQSTDGEDAPSAALDNTAILDVVNRARALNGIATR